jgi:hypothetical protein
MCVIKGITSIYYYAGIALLRPASPAIDVDSVSDMLRELGCSTTGRLGLGTRGWGAKWRGNFSYYFLNTIKPTRNCGGKSALRFSISHVTHGPAAIKKSKT